MSLQLKIELSPERHLARWEELCADPELAKLSYRLETDRFDRLLMSPPPAFDHTRRVSKIIKLLQRLLPEGEATAETPILTLDGVKVADCAWFSHAYWQELAGQDPAALSRAPEICVEVLSPSNSEEEMDEKRALYFEAGAQEVWLCDLESKISFFDSEGRREPASKLCPSFPDHI